MKTLTVRLVTAVLLASGCGNSTNTPPNGGAGAGTGAAGSGASANGGMSNGGAGGSATGGSPAGGGPANGGSANGGSQNGGSANGGSSAAGGSKSGGGGSSGASGGKANGGGAGDPFAIGSSVPREQLPAVVAKVRCALDLRCGLAFSKLEAAACVERAVGFDPVVARIEELIARGKLTYDPETMAQCLTFLRDRGCQSFGLDTAPGSPLEAYTSYLVDPVLSWAANPACREALLGDVPPGGGCYSKFECASGICEIPSGGATCGSCAEPLALQASCVGGELISGSYFDRCGLDAYCDRGTNRCTARLKEGAACNNDTSRACALGLKCATPATGGSGTCKRFAAETEACADLGTLGGPLCANWLYCSTTCRREVGPLGATGDTCAGGELCLPGLVCDGTACRAPSALNAPCFAADDPDACVDGSYCDWNFTAGVCRAKAAQGGACSVQAACADDLACLSETSMCGPKKGEGEACSTFHGGQGECESPLQCLGSTAAAPGDCAQLAELGEACSGMDGCAAGLSCMSGRCQLAGFPYLGCP